MWPILLVCFFMIHQGASMPLTQEDIDKWMPYILEKMETKFQAEVESITNEIIELKKGINECHTNPCQNQGTCTDMPSGYTCTCVPGFTGKSCEVNFDECSENPCGVHGTCTDLINEYKCVCETGYFGLNCDSQTPPCHHTNPCQNQGNCTDVPSGYTCSCAPGFIGTNCEVNFDECSENPCGGHGTCTDLINSYKCVCETGYFGLNCESTCSTNDQNYHLLNDHCIFLEKSEKNYEDAKQNCETKFGGHGKLFEPKTWSENEMAFKIAKAAGSSTWWIGVNDKQTEGSFVYESNGSPLSYTPKFYTLHGYGSKGTSYNCILFYPPSSGDESDIVHWLDFPCNNSYYSICENST